jgi:hypothetical protein
MARRRYSFFGHARSLFRASTSRTVPASVRLDPFCPLDKRRAALSIRCIAAVKDD